jgi:predicted MPP superfamily phosphohydrolase
MRRFRFFVVLLVLTLLPQLLAAAHLVEWLLASRDGRVRALSPAVFPLLALINVPLAVELLRRRRVQAVPRLLAAALQIPWTAFWLGSVLYAVALLLWSSGALAAKLLWHGQAPPMPSWLALAPFALSLYGALFASRMLRRERVTIPVLGLPPGWAGARIVQLSDLHAGRHMTAERLQAIARRAARLSPDVLVVTGDIVHNSAAFARRAADAIASVPTRLGTFACLGNHDFYAGADLVADELRAAGVPVLRNQGRLLTRGGDGLWLCGVDDVWSSRFDLQAALRGKPEGAAVVLLSHQPNTWPLAQAAHVQLQLSGHTHGGQLALLWLHRSLSLARFITPFVAGLYQAGSSYLYVNRGAGSVMPLIRLGARPEVTEITLVPAEAGAEELAPA